MNINKLRKFDINNGVGIRLSIWTAGCSHKCKGCWNKELWNPENGKPYKEWKAEIEEALKDDNIDGVSILGGEPLFELMEHNKKDDIVDLLNLCNVYHKSIWMWTGYEFEEVPQFIKDRCSVIITGKFEEDKKTDDLSLYKGSTNQKFNYKYLSDTEAKYLKIKKY